MLRDSGGRRWERESGDSESRKSFLALVPTGGDHIDKKNTGGMERSGNFWLSCDIKEA